MGYTSPIASSKNLLRIKGFYHLNGYEVRLKKEIAPIGLQNMFLSSSPNYLEIFPHKDKLASIVLITPLKNYNNMIITNELEFIINSSPYKHYFERSIPNQMYRGLVPIGILKKNLYGRILFFGEAGQMNPASSSTTLTKLLKIFKQYSNDISEWIRTDNSDTKTLTFLPAINRFNQIFQINLFDEILDFNSDRFLNLIQEMQNFDDSLINDMIFGELDFSDLVKRRSLLTFFSNKTNILRKSLLKTLLSLK